jgi:hypothetical protein
MGTKTAPRAKARRSKPLRNRIIGLARDLRLFLEDHRELLPGADALSTPCACFFNNGMPCQELLPETCRGENGNPAPGQHCPPGSGLWNPQKTAEQNVHVVLKHIREMVDVSLTTPRKRAPNARPRKPR